MKTLKFTVVSAGFVALTAFLSMAFAQNVGIGIPVPQEKLDVAGSLRVDGRVSMIPQVVAAADAISADANRSTIIVQTTTGVQANAITLTGTPVPGQVLYITNLDDNSATFSSISIPANETRGFLYRATPTAGWTAIADNLGDHTATAPLNMANHPINNASAVGIGTAAPSGVLDVVSEIPLISQLASPTTLIGSFSGQTFTAPANVSTLTAVAFELKTSVGGGSVKIQLFAGETLSLSSPLGETNTISLSYTGTTVWETFTFTSPIALTPGQLYTLRLIKTGSVAGSLTSAPNPYSGGQSIKGSPAVFLSDDAVFILYGPGSVFQVAQDGSVQTTGGLQIKGDFIVKDGALRMENTADSKRYELNYDASNDYFYIDEYGAARRLIIKNGGNVGIGTENPQYKLEVADTRATNFVANFQNNGDNGKGINITINDNTNNISNGGFKDESGWDDTWYNSETGYLIPQPSSGDPTLLPAPAGSHFITPAQQSAVEARILAAEQAGNFTFQDNEPDINASRYYYGVDADNEFIRFTGADGATTIVAGSVQGFSYQDYAETYAMDPCEALEFVASFIDLDPAAIFQTLLAASCESAQDVQFGVTYASGGGDYAEYLERENHAETMTRGEIVGVKSGKISRNLDGAEKLMVISSRPIVLGNMPQEGREAFYEKVAFLGQAEIRIRGAVQAGDYILPSGKNDGYGVPVSPANMQPADYARVVGRAWASNPLDGPKFINCIVGLQNNEWAQVLQTLQNQVAELKQANAALQQNAQTMQQQQDDFRAEMRAEMQSLRKEMLQTTSYSAE